MNYYESKSTKLYPLTLPQQTFYLDYLLHQNNSKYNMGAPMILNGDLDIDLYRKAYDYIIQKYDILRLRFVLKDGELFQTFLSEQSSKIEYLDYRNRENAFNEAIEFTIEENKEPFPFENVPLFSDCIIQTGEKQYILFVRFQHFSNDAYGRSVINQALSNTYNSLLKGNGFPEIKSFPYLDFLEDDLKYRDSVQFKNSAIYWQNKLSPLAVPFDFTLRKNAIKNFSLHNERVTLNLHRMCYASLLKIADQTGVTSFQALLGILFVTLYKLFNKEDIVIGMPILNRGNFKFKNTPGLFMNMIPLRLSLLKEWSFKDILNAIKMEVRGSYRHQRLPLSETYKYFRNNPDFKNELFDVTFIYRKMDYSQSFGDARLHTETLDTQLRAESLSIEVDEYNEEDNVNLFFNYNPLVFSKQEVVQLTRCFENILFELIYFPEKSIDKVELISPFDKHQITHTFNNENEVKSTSETIVSAFNNCVEMYPDQASIIENDKIINYTDLHLQSNCISNYLIENHHISKGDIICLAAQGSVESVACMLGIMKSGAVFLPVDSQLPPARIEFILQNSKAKILITDNKKLLNLSVEVLLMDNVEGTNSENPSLKPEREDLAYIIYTSGSTGTPKGVMIEHGSFMHMFVNVIDHYGVKHNDRVLQFASFGFDAAIFEILQALLTGASLVITRRELIMNPNNFIQYMNDKKVTIATLPPAYLNALEKPEFPYLHTIITAGEPARISDVNHYRKFKRYINGYGPTETSVCASFFHAKSDQEYNHHLPIGKAIPGTSIYILNEAMEVLPVGFSGELCIAGPHLARGYINNSKLTRQKFISSPFDNGQRMYRTGDLARWQTDGTIEFLGRIDDQVKINGNRIELGEIEDRLKNYTLVKDAVVLDVDLNGTRSIAAYIVGDENMDLSVLKKFLLDFLPAYMLPSHFIFIDKIPLTQNGKVNKHELRKVHPKKLQSSSEKQNPTTELEQKLIQIFGQVLKYDSIKVHDNFFELGGDSLKIARLITLIKKQLHLEIKFKTIFDNPTVEGVASELELCHKSQFQEIKIAQSKEYYPLSHAQKRLWILSYDIENNAAYNMPVPVLLEGELNLANIKKAIYTIVDRHEALRTIFITKDDLPYQQILQSYDNFIYESDFSIDNDPEVKANTFINKAIMVPFDISDEIPIRVHSIKISENKSVLLLLIHHIAGDGVSISVIMNELTQLYNSFQAGDQQFKLNPLRIQYKDYCMHELELLTSDAYTEEKEYWLNVLKGPIPVLNLPTDRVRPSVKNYNGKILYGKLDEKLSKNLKKFGKEHHLSPFMIVLASVNILLYKYTSQEDLIIGAPIAGRDHEDLKDQVGVYINTIALRNQIKSDKTFIDFLHDVKNTSSAAFSNSNYPFDQLIQDLNLDRDTSRSPIFDVLIQYENQDVTTLRLNGVKSSSYQLDYTISKFDLAFTFTEHEKDIEFYIEFNTSLFDSSRIERTQKHLINILSNSLENPKALIKDIDIVDSVEALSLMELADGGSLKIDHKTVIDLFNEQVKKSPDTTALVFNEIKLSYKQLDEQANVVANEIRRNIPVNPDDIIAIMAPPAEWTVIGILGILKTGAAYLPVSLDLPAERIRFILQNSNSKLFLAFNDLISKAKEIVNSPYSKDGTNIQVIDISKIENPLRETPTINLLPSSLAYVLYTSGSTGMPKGVMIEHRSIVSLVYSLTKNSYSNYKEPENELLMTSFMFDVSVQQLFSVLCNGHALHVLKEESKHAASEIIDYVISKKIEIMHLTPSLFSVLLEAGFGEITKPHLKELYIGAEALSYKSIEKFLSSQHNNEINIYNLYGPTECCVGSTIFKIHPRTQSVEHNQSGIVSIGKPIYNEQVYILDKDLSLCPIGIPGEIYIAGIGLARGYLNDESKTKEQFFEVPFLPGKKVYKTGDLGKLAPDGNIEFLGRIDDQVKVRGFRIELLEIEEHLKHFEAINACVVVLHKNNQDENEIAAYFTSDEKLDISKIQDHLVLFLPIYMVPQYFVQMENIPLTISGKANRKLLPDPILSKVNLTQTVEPRTNLEKKLIEIWKELLEVEEIGIFDDFFNLGGHSLVVMRLTLQIQKKLNITVKIWDVFQHSTVASLAEFLKERKVSFITPVEKVKIRDYYPLSHAQRRLWILSKLQKHDSLYNIPVVLQLKGKVDVDALEKSFNLLVQRHDSFRTFFIEIDGQPYQKIDSEVKLKFQRLDYSNKPNKEEELNKIILENSSAIFDLSSSPLLKVQLFKKSEQDYLLLVNMHHIISDGWSFDVIFKELGIAYNSVVNNKPFPLQALRIQYKDFVLWQNKILEEQTLEEIKSYWHNKLSSPPQQTGFPKDFKRPEKYSNEGDLIIQSLDKQLTERLFRLGNNHQASVFMIMTAAVNVLLNKYTANKDIIVGSPVAGRQHDDLKDQIGFYVNTLAIRNYVDPENTFSDFLDKVKTSVSEAMDNQVYPFDKLIDELGLERQINHNPLFDVMIVWMVKNSTSLAQTFLGIDVKNIDLNLNKSKFDLSFMFEEENSKIRFAIEYNSKLYRKDTVNRIAANFIVLLNNITENSSEKIKSIEVLSSIEKKNLLYGFNDSKKEISTTENALTLFKQQVEKNKDAAALVFGENTLSYKGLNSLVNRIANTILKKQAPQKDELIAVIADDPVLTIASVYAIMKTGAAYLPILSDNPAERIITLLEDTKSRLILVDDSTIDMVSGIIPASCKLLNLSHLDTDDEQDPLVEITQNQLAYIIYTSGSTGNPKGVMIEHKALFAFTKWLQNDIYCSSKGHISDLMLSSFSFDASIIQIFGALCSGNTLHLLKKEWRNNSRYIVNYVVEKNINMLELSPSLFSLLLEEGFSERQKPEFKYLCLAGEALPHQLVKKFLKEEENKTVEIYNMYGPTECCVVSTCYLYDPENENNFDIVPIGKPILNDQVYILDSELNPCPVGVKGEIYIGGNGLSRGYLNATERTNEKFTEFHQLNGKRIYKTNDLGSFLPDGNIEFWGRSDRQIKLHGYRIELNEIEERLRTYKNIKDVIIILEYHNGDPYLAAYFTSTIHLDIQDIRLHLEKYLPKYSVPASFVQLDKMPLSSNGKIDSKKIPLTDLAIPKKIISSEDSLENKISEIWSNLLNIDTIDSDDNFFDIGGNSLTAIRFSSRVHKELNIELNVSEIFQNPTVQLLSEVIKSKNPALFNPISKIEDKEFYPLSHSQHRLWFLSKVEGQESLYNLPIVIQFFGTVNKDALEKSFQQLVERHESLRTRFIEIEGEPYQKIVDVNNFKIEYEDYSLVADSVSTLNNLAKQNSSKEFDLSVAPLLQVKLVKTSKENYLLFVNMPHIISDGWSLDVLLKELEVFYNAYEFDSYVNLLPLRIQYKDYAAWQNQLLNSDLLDKTKQYWLQKLSLPRQQLELPLDYNRPEKYTVEGDLLIYQIDNKIISNLKKISIRYNSSLYMTLLAAVNVLLYKYTSIEDIILGTPVAGRQHVDLENQFGFYVNTVVLRNSIHPDNTFSDLLRQVKTTLSEAIDNQSYPFDKLVDELDVERITNHNPLFDVMVSWMINSGSSTRKKFSNIEMQGLNLLTKKSMFDLSIIFEENEKETSFAIEYNTALFNKNTIDAIAIHFNCLLESIVENPSEKINQLVYIPKIEKEKLLYEFNQTDEPESSFKNVIELFEKKAAKREDLSALITDGKEFSYGELNDLANRFANHLIKTLSPQKNDIIAVIVDDPILAVASLLAILKSGAAYLPILSSNPEERINFILENSKCKAVLTNLDFLGSSLPCQAIHLNKVAEVNDSNPRVLIQPNDLAYVIYTSGSTGKPKGVLIEHRSLQNLIFSLQNRIYAAYNFPQNELMITSFGFDVSVKQIFASLCSGNTLHILDKEKRLDPREIVKYIVDKNINIVDLTSSLFTAMLEEGFGELAKPELKELFLGSEALPCRSINAFLKHEDNKQVNIYNFYGPTECCVESSCYKFDNHTTYTADIAPIGKPVGNERIYILDKHLNIRPIGIPGEICISGVGLAREYLNDPAKTSEKFVDFPLLPGTRIYKTGDLGKIMPDGNIEFIGRIDEQVKVRGYRIELAEIEKHLCDYNKLIEAVVVLHQKNDEGKLVAYFRSDETADVSEIKKYLQRQLPEYMIPAFFIQLDKIPLLASGKVNKKQLPDPVLNISSNTEFESPTNEIESKLLRTWQDVLDVENISIHDNFFDLGGNSFLLVKLHKKICSQYPDILTLTDLFSKSKIAEQATYIMDKTSGESKTFTKRIATSETKLKNHDIAVVGISAKVGDCTTVDELWNDLRLGVDFIGSIPEERIPDIKEWCEKSNMDITSLKFRKGSFVQDIDKFDYGFFKLSPLEASVIDPGQRLFLQTAYNAMEDAGYAGKTLWGSRTGIFIGSSKTLAEYSKFIELSEIQDTNLLLSAQTPSIIASRLSYLLNLKGPALLVDTACSSSLVALHLACQSIRDGKIESAIVGGVNLNLLSIDNGVRTEIDASDGKAHSFDDSANGTGGGEGVIAVMLKPLEKAIEDKDNVYAVIKGSYINQDGNSNGIAAPDADAQADVIERAWLDAAIDPETISFIETHGTGTKLGDPIEIDGITKAFNNYTDQKQICAIGALKANIGHLDSAAGLAGFLKAVLSLKNRELTPLTHFKTPNRNINFEDSAAFVNKNLSAWNKNGHPLRCGVSSFGLSGTNCHVILEEAPAKDKKPTHKETKFLFTLSARNQDVLLNYIKKIKHQLYQVPEGSENEICYTLSSGRAHYRHRLAIIFKSKSELITKLSEVLNNGLNTDTEKQIFANHFRISTSNKAVLSANQTTENEIRKISNEINLMLKKDNSGSDRITLTAQAYVNGADILWNEFYKTEQPHKISMPGYPFEKNRCWIKLKDKDLENISLLKSKNQFGQSTLKEYEKKYDAVFLNRCLIDTPVNSIYSTLYDEKTWWLLRDHKIMGNPALVGAAYLQIAYEAGKNHLVSEGLFTEDSLFIEDFYMIQAITLYDKNTLEVLTTINKIDKNKISLETHSKSEDKSWQKYSELKIRTEKDLTTQDISSLYLNIDEIKSRMTSSIEIDNIERDTSNNSFINVSDKWNCLNKIYQNGNEFLGELSIPSKDLSLAESYAFYPPLIDAAVSFGLNESGYLPYSYGNVELKSEISGPIYSYIQKKDSSSQETSAFKITITNTKGKILAIFTDFLLKKVHAPKLNNFFHELVWKPRDLDKQKLVQSPSVFNAENIVVFHSGKTPTIDSFANKQCFNILDRNSDEILGNIFKHPNQQAPDKVIYLLPETAIGELKNNTSLEQYLERSLYQVFNFAKYLVSNVSSKLEILFVGTNVSEITAKETNLNSLSMAVSGLAHVLQMESPNINCRFLDIDKQTTSTEIVNELELSFTEPFFYAALRNSQRYIRELKPINLIEKKKVDISFTDKGVYVITGGTGGIGLELASYLAKRALEKNNSRIKLVLLNRSKFPDKKDWAKILQEKTDTKLCRKIEKLREIEVNLAELHLFKADVADYESIKNIIAKIETDLGKINGLIHCAGVPGDGFIFGKTIDTFRNVIAPKIHGTINLATLIDHQELDFFAMASSMTGVLPAPGQSDYTAANIFLDAFAAELNKKGINAMSIDFTAWKETGMAFDFNVVEDGIFKSVTTQNALMAFDEILQRKTNSVLFGESNFALIGSEEIPFFIDNKLLNDRKPATKQEAPLTVNSAIILKGHKNDEYSDLEKSIAEVWAVVLGYEELNVFDNYYDLGGDSIHAIKINSLLKEKLDSKLTIADLFNHLSIAELAGFLESQNTTPHKIGNTQNKLTEIIPVSKTEYYPASSAQRRLFFLDQESNDKFTNHMPEIWQIKGAFNTQLFNEAVNKLIAHQESLRTSFKSVDGLPVQVILDKYEYAVQLIEMNEKQAQRYIQTFIKPFDLAIAPLIRIEIIKLSPINHLVLFDGHHIVLDAFSMEVLISELFNFYRGIEPEPIRIHYKDFAQWQNNYYQSEEVRLKMSYWLKEFKTGFTSLDLPVHHSTTVDRSFDAGVYSFSLGKELTSKVKKMSAFAGTSTFMILLAASKVVLGNFAGKDDITIGIASIGRDNPELSKLVGMFINYLPVRTWYKNSMSQKEYLQTVKKAAINGFANNDFPLDTLVNELVANGSIKSKSLFDVVFSYMNFENTEIEKGNMEIEPYNAEFYFSSEYDLMIYGTETEDNINITFKHRKSIWQKNNIEAFASLFLKYVEAFALKKEILLGDFPLLEEKEDLKLLIDYKQ